MREWDNEAEGLTRRMYLRSWSAVIGGRAVVEPIERDIENLRFILFIATAGHRKVSCNYNVEK